MIFTLMNRPIPVIKMVKKHIDYQPNLTPQPPKNVSPPKQLKLTLTCPTHHNQHNP